MEKEYFKTYEEVFAEVEQEYLNLPKDEFEIAKLIYENDSLQLYEHTYTTIKSLSTVIDLAKFLATKVKIK